MTFPRGFTTGSDQNTHTEWEGLMINTDKRRIGGQHNAGRTINAEGLRVNTEKYRTVW